MSIDENDPILQRAKELRRSFDESFAVAHRRETDVHEDFIAIRLGENPYAIRLREVSGLFDRKVITPLPGSVSGLLGVASFRGTIVPVFDLRALLGHSRGLPPRWVVLLPARSPVSLAFDQFEGHLRLPRNPSGDKERQAGRDYVQGVVSVAGVSRPVLHVQSILDEIGKRAAMGPKRSGNYV